MCEDLLDLGPHAEHGAGQHVVRLAPQTDLALLAQGSQLAVSAPARNKHVAKKEQEPGLIDLRRPLE